MALHDRNKEEICAEKRESVSIVKRRMRRDEGVCSRAAKEGVYPTVKVTTDGTGILCGKEGQCQVHKQWT